MDDDVACLLIVPTSGGAGTIKRILFSTNFLFPRIVFLPFKKIRLDLQWIPNLSLVCLLFPIGLKLPSTLGSNNDATNSSFIICYAVCSTKLTRGAKCHKHARARLTVETHQKYSTANNKQHMHCTNTYKHGGAAITPLDGICAQKNSETERATIFDTTIRAGCSERTELRKKIFFSLSLLWAALSISI